MRVAAAWLLAAALLRAAPSADVRDFGARGDGRADDTAAIQKAVDSGRGAIFLSKGAYRITAPVLLDLARSGPLGVRGDGTATLIMAGEGPAIDIVGSHKTSADPKGVLPVTATRERAPLIDGFSIRGEHAAAVGIRARGTIHANFSRLLLTGLRDGIVLTGLNRNVLVSEVNVYDNSGVGILLEKLNLHQVNIVNSHVSYNKRGGIVVRESEIRNLQISACDIEANMVPGGPPSANVLFDTRGGSIREGAIAGCSIQHYGKAKGSANIRFIGEEKAPRKVGFFSIGDNMISDADVNIHLRHARGVNITGNTFALGFSHNLLVEGSSNVALGPNTMDQNPDYDQAGFRNTVEFLDSSDSSIHGLAINRSRGSEAALIVRRSHHFQIVDASILDSDGAGILLDNVEWTRVAGCMIHDRRPETRDPAAIRVVGGRNLRLESNMTHGRVDAPAIE